MSAEQYPEAIRLIRAGEIIAGRKLIIQVLRSDPGNEKAWLWLAQTLAGDDERRRVLQECLKHNPHGSLAAQALAALEARRGENTLAVAPPPAKAPGADFFLPAQPLEADLADLGTEELPEPLPAGIEEESPEPPPAGVEEEPTPVEAAPKKRRPRPQAKRVRIWVAVPVVLLAGVFTIAVLFVAGLLRANQAAQLAAGGTPTPIPSLNPALLATPTPMPTPTQTLVPALEPLTVPQLPGDRQAIGAANLENLRPLAILGRQAAFASPTNLVAKYIDNQVMVWDSLENVQVASISLPEENVGRVLFSPDGSLIAVASDRLGVSLWNAQTGELLHTLNFPPAGVKAIYDGLPLLKGTPRSAVLSFAPDGSVLTATAAGMVAAWNVTGGELLYSLVAAPEQVDQALQALQTDPAYPISASYTLAFSPDSRTLALAGFGVLQVVDLQTRLAGFETGDLEPLNPIIAFSPDGRWLGISRIGRVMLIDPLSGESGRVFNGLQSYDRPALFGFSPNRQSIVIEEDGDCCGRVVLNQYNLASGSLEKAGTPLESSPGRLAFSADGKISLVGDTLSAASGDILGLGGLNDLSFTSDGKALLANLEGALVVYGVSESAPQVRLPSKPIRLTGPSQNGAPLQPSFLTRVGDSLMLWLDGVRRYDPRQRKLLIVKEIYESALGANSVDDIFYFFVANPGEPDAGLWRSDGTAGGTLELKKGAFRVSAGFESAALGKNLFFVAQALDGPAYQLWKSGKNPGSTLLVKTLSDGYEPSQPPHNLVALDEALYFSFEDPQNGAELWASDGTAEGTGLLKDICQGCDGQPTSLTAWKGALIFVATSNENRPALWLSDGSEKGTVELMDFGSEDPAIQIDQLTLFGERLALVVTRRASVELWVSDGSRPGSGLLKSFPASASPAGIKGLVSNGKTLLFFANDGAGGPALWRSDGTAVGTTSVSALQPGAAWSSSADRYLQRLDPPIAMLGSTAYFSVYDEKLGSELWQSDGTPAGTHLVADLTVGPDSTAPYMFTPLTDSLFFLDGKDMLWELDSDDLD